MEPVGRRDLPAFPPFDAVTLANWLGAPVAMLSQPPGLVHYASNQSHSIGHAPQIPVAVTIEHRFDSSDPFDLRPAVMANVRTRLRQAQGEPDATTTQQNIAEAVRDYMEGSAARAGISLRPSKRPPEFDAYLGRELRGWSWWDVTVDGVVVQWAYLPTRDYATNEEIIGLGGQTGDTLIAVVGPAQRLTTVALRLCRPQ